MILLASLVVWSAESLAAPAPKGGLVLNGQPVVFGSRRRAGRRELSMFTRTDAKEWQEVGIVTTDPSPTADLGDGNAIRFKDGRIWATFRRNHRGAALDYAIEVAESRDGGKTWAKHSTVETSKPLGAGPSRGLWAPFLFVSSKGEVQCYYDDEHTPWAKGKSGHQWISMRAWREGKWSEPTVAAKEPSGLSRDGMASVVEVEGKILCAVEAVRAEAPHAGLLRLFSSSDGGRSWTGPTTLYAPKDARFHAFAPSLVAFDHKIVAVFATNEDRPDSPPSGTPADRMMLDIKSVESSDNGKSWSDPALVYAGSHRNYLPSAVALDSKRLIVTFLDFDKGAHFVEGQLSR